MVELLWFIQADITWGGNEIHKAFLYSVNNLRIFRIPELFTIKTELRFLFPILQ